MTFAGASYLTWELCPPRPLQTPRESDRSLLSTALSDALSRAESTRAFASVSRRTRARTPVSRAPERCEHSAHPALEANRAASPRDRDR